MNLSPVDTATFKAVCHFDRKTPTREDHFKRLNEKGAIYYHALLHVKQQDPFAIERLEAPFSFPKLIKQFFKENNAYEEGTSWKAFNLLPDLLAIDYQNFQLRFHEIEDTHPLEKPKLAKYIRLFEYGDADALGVRLFVYDRYGLHQRELSLSSLSIITS